MPTGTTRAPKSDPPLPFRADAVDDADGLYAQLVDFTDSWMRHLPVLPPEARAWRVGDDAGGLPANVTPAGAQTLTWLVCRWLLAHHSQFLLLPPGLNYFDDAAASVGRLRGKYPMAPRPPRKALKRACPSCAEFAVVAKIPQDPLDVEVVCEQCGFVVPGDAVAIVEGWMKCPNC